jgi:hypothetical protein
MESDKLVNASSTDITNPNAPGSPLHQPTVETLLNKRFTVAERFLTRRPEAKIIGDHRAAIATEVLGARLEQVRIARRTAENRWRLEAAAFLAAYSGSLHRQVATQLEDIQAALLRDMGHAETRLFTDFEQQFAEVDALPERFRQRQSQRLSDRLDRHLKFIEEDLINSAYERLRKIREAFPVV